MDVAVWKRLCACHSVSYSYQSVKGLLAHFIIEQGRAQNNPDACLLYHRDNECWRRILHPGVRLQA